jgi:integrase
MGLMALCNKYLDFATKYQPKVYDEKVSVCKRLVNAWGKNFPVNLITEEMCEKYLSAQMKLRSANASNKDRKNLKAMWNKSTVYGIQSNPWNSTEKFAHDAAPPYTPPIEDVLRLLAVATRNEKIFLDCYIQTGARRSEIFRLLWTDVDFNRRMIRLGTRKTKDGSMKYRNIEMSDSLYQSLWWQWENRKFRRSPYVFIDDQPGPHYGKPYKARRRFMAGLCKRAGVKQFGFHALRRFVASVLDSKNVPLKQIQLILGHSRPTTTDRYLDNLHQGQKVFMDRISEALIPETIPETKKGETVKTVNPLK